MENEEDFIRKYTSCFGDVIEIHKKENKFIVTANSFSIKKSHFYSLFFAGKVAQDIRGILDFRYILYDENKHIKDIQITTASFFPTKNEKIVKISSNDARDLNLMHLFNQ